MKSAIYCSVLTLVSLWTLTVFGQGSCHNDQGGGYPTDSEPGYPYDQTSPYGQPAPYGQPSPYAAGGSFFPTQAPAVATPAGPTSRITLVSANSAAESPTASTTPSAKLTVVADSGPAGEPLAIDSTIAGLVGNWKAVARQGDGELTTVELHLDNHGWAELTVPGSDGKPSTTKSRVNLENQELKLTGTDKVVSLGKLVDFNSRQMVLERAEGQVTFVRL